jgi:hypothetical protein
MFIFASLLFVTFYINIEKVMKNMKFGFFGALALAATMFATGCTDPCKDVTCVKGECVEGDCVCDTGYEGVDCGTAFNAKMTGSYTLTETCTSGPDNYAVTFTPKSTSAVDVTIAGLYREATALTGAIGADGVSFTVAKTSLTAGLDIEVTSGTSNAAGTSINIGYKIYTAGTTTVVDQCTGTLTK